jgi:excisionase family DNA binding protein
MDAPKFFTIDESASILRISRITVQRKIASGEIKATHLGKRVLIPAVFFENLTKTAWPEMATDLPVEKQ